MSFFNDLIEEYEFLSVEEEEKEKEKRKTKKAKRIINVRLDEKYIEELKRDSIMKTSGETDILIKTSDGKIQHEKLYGNRLEALNVALRIKSESPESTVKMIIK